jgi:hypothetical protein
MRVAVNRLESVRQSILTLHTRRTMPAAPMEPETSVGYAYSYRKEIMGSTSDARLAGK